MLHVIISKSILFYLIRKATTSSTRRRKHDVTMLPFQTLITSARYYVRWQTKYMYTVANPCFQPNTRHAVFVIITTKTLLLLKMISSSVTVLSLAIRRGSNVSYVNCAQHLTSVWCLQWLHLLHFVTSATMFEAHIIECIKMSGLGWSIVRNCLVLVLDLFSSLQ